MDAILELESKQIREKMSKNSFCAEMRKATRDVHSISDALVNLRVALSMSDNSIWAEGLMIFYEIFKFLEEAMKRHEKERLGRFLIDGIERKTAFESDLRFFAGVNWKKSYTVRNEVADYVTYLKNLEAEDPDLLIAYVYHLYLGLLSGGQILKRKRQLKDMMRLNNSPLGYSVTEFGEKTISSVKTDIKSIMENIADELDGEKKSRLLEESQRVFEWNNKIIKTVRQKPVVKNLIILLLKIIVVFLILYWAFW